MALYGAKAPWTGRKVPYCIMVAGIINPLHIGDPLVKIAHVDWRVLQN